MDLFTGDPTSIYGGPVKRSSLSQIGVKAKIPDGFILQGNSLANGISLVFDSQPTWIPQAIWLSLDTVCEKPDGVDFHVCVHNVSE